MKHLLLLLILVTSTFLTGCFPEYGIIQEDELLTGTEFSEISVEVGIVLTSNGSKCGETDTQLRAIPGADVVIYKTGAAGAEDSPVFTSGTTDARGRIVFSEVPGGSYSIEVDSYRGRQTLRLEARPGVRHNVTFRF